MAVGPHQEKVLKRKRQDAAIEKGEYIRHKLKTTNGPPSRRVVSPLQRAQANGYLEHVCKVRGIPYTSVRESMPAIAAHFGFELSEISGAGHRSKAAVALAKAISEKVGILPSLERVAAPRKLSATERAIQAEKEWRKTLTPAERAKLAGRSKPRPTPQQLAEPTLTKQNEKMQARAARKQRRKAKAAAKQEAIIRKARGNLVELQKAGEAALEQMIRVAPPDEAYSRAVEALEAALFQG